MKKRRSLLRLAGTLFTATLVSVYNTGAQEVKELPNDSGEIRADVITIDTLKGFGDLERPEVVFLHDLHTDALCSSRSWQPLHLTGPAILFLASTNDKKG